MRIIGIGAHPDDIEIYFAGLLAVAQAKGHEVHWLVATSGGAYGTGEASSLRERRRGEARAAAALFGITPIFLDREDGGLPADTAATGLLAAEFARLRPDLVVTHAANDYHPDHRALSTYVADAASFRTPVLLADTMLGIDFQPGLYVDISAHMERKEQALALHASQPTGQYLEFIEVWNRFRGLQSGNPACRYAEAFRFEPRFPFGAIDGILRALI
jgi:N-acetylglucosamine malate deacetylase 1